MADALDPDLVQVCRKCDGPLEAGYVMGITGYNNVGFAPTTIGWLGRPPQGRGINDQLYADPLAKGGWFWWSRSPRFPAVRCRRCHLVEFSYETVLYHPEGTPSAEPASPPLASAKSE